MSKSKFEPLRIGNVVYEYKTWALDEIKARFKAIYTHPLYTPGDLIKIKSSDQAWVYELLLRHPNAESILESLKAPFSHMAYHCLMARNVRFAVVDTKGNHIPWSYQPAIEGNPPSTFERWSKVIRSCTRGQIKEYCEERNINSETIDHIIPLSYVIKNKILPELYDSMGGEYVNSNDFFVFDEDKLIYRIKDDMVYNYILAVHRVFYIDNDLLEPATRSSNASKGEKMTDEMQQLADYILEEIK